jgi:hypothetical protein
MKKLYNLLLIMFCMTTLHAQEYYYNGSEKIEIYASEKSFIIFEDTEQITHKGFEKAES